MTDKSDHPQALDAAAVQQFITQGFVRLDRAFAPSLAERAREILWHDLPGHAADPSSWHQPVVRLGMYQGEPFFGAANSPRLHATFDQLVGQGRWLPCGSMGTFPVRFPVPGEPGDTGWHIDMSFDWQQPDFMSWRANVVSSGRALTMLFLFSDVGPDDAPTRLRAGSHLHIARQLAPAGDAGMTLRALAADGFASTAQCPEVAATGVAGTVYLCHPFLVHAAQQNRGNAPRFLAQPPLLPREPLNLRRDAAQLSPLERSIRLALED